MEDEEALDGAELLHMFLDDCGNVVRQWRTDVEGEDFYFNGTWKENFYTGRAELGPAYRAGLVVLRVQGFWWCVELRVCGRSVDSLLVWCAKAWNSPHVYSLSWCSIWRPTANEAHRESGVTCTPSKPAIIEVHGT